ncbi:hypothetical protein TSAR_006757 [Trichomalopsis sarcophagae]|uniref:Uncharacterized protein n=1 Tax=Trichomalopsis sarcophagae TaxID=543379 RepID=A0A232EUH7_9HYME|nr:hypothetical protein TSAR_006757 [Trichomalopsis sarcophagae]
MESGTLARVLRDFLTTTDGEISLHKGDFFLVHKVVDKLWCYGQSHNRLGKFPVHSLHKVDVPPVNDNESLFISIAPFRGEQPGDLSFSQGEIIIGNAESSSDWLTGHIGPREGIFPASYVWQLDLNILKKSMQKKIVKRKAKVKANLTAQLDEELDLVEGEIVTVTEILDDGWCRGYKDDGKEGIFPEGFITYQDDTNIDEIDNTCNAAAVEDNSFPSSAMSGRIYKDFGESVNYTPEARYDDPAPNYEDLFPEKSEIHHSPKIEVTSDYNPLGLKPYAISLFPFNAQFPNELSFGAGQVVELVKYTDNEWAEGMIDNVKGIFPVSYVNVIVDCVDSQDDMAPDDGVKEQDQDDLQSNDRVKVEYKFDAQMAGDLNVSEGEIVTVVEANDEWITVRNDKGETGLCPRSYLTTDFESSDDVFHDALDDYVVIRHENKNTGDKEIDKSKRLSEPHRPAPPAPSPGRVPLQKQNHQAMTSNEESDASLTKQKKADQRQNLITELYVTEKDFVRDLKMTYETFHLHNPAFLESRKIDVATLFGNISQIIEVAEELLELIQRAMKGIDEDYQSIGPCFLKMSEKMRVAYGKYCSNHEASLALLQKYEDNEDIMRIFNKGVETLRVQVHCFDMSSVLIKPVQRILKYPLLLDGLLKCTEDGHPDKPKIEEASKVMADVASYINEYKRKKDLASKYLHSNNTLIGKMANLNMHSVAKKSSRLSAKLSATLGLTNLPIDPKFEELVKDFLSLEKSTKQFLKDVEQCIQCLDAETYCGEVLTEQLHQYYTGVRSDEVWRLREVRQIIRSQYIKDFKSCIERRVISPLNALISLLSGPELLINKRHDKMLDYDTAISRRDRAEDISSAKSNFEALNQQLLEELPVFIQASTAILYNCIGAFTNARKLYNGKILKKYMNISEVVKQLSLEDIYESYFVHHHLLYNQITRLSYGGTNARVEKDSVDYCLQSEVHKKAVREKYPPNKLYILTRSITGPTPHDLSATKGTLVGVIKTMDPMGDTSKWFVDNGSMKGFVESQYLEISDEAKLIEESAAAVSIDSSVDLMSLDSPVKEANRYSADIQSLYSDVSDDLDPPPNYENLDDITPKEPRQLYENIHEEFVYALYEFNHPELVGTLSVKEGQALKVLEKHDQKNNPDWWLVEDRTGGKGYVPENYLGKKQN